MLKVIEKIPALLRGFDLSVAKKQFDLLQIVQSTQWEVNQVLGYLKHQPDSWVVIRPTHPWYSKAKEGADTLLRHTLAEPPVFLLHLQSRWLLIVTDGNVFPAIFLFTDERRDGLAVSFYRILSGSCLSLDWIALTKKLVNAILEANPEPEPQVELPSPYADLFKVKLHG